MSDERRPPTNGIDERLPGAGDEIAPDAPASEEELLASQRLRDALGDVSRASAVPTEDLELVRSLRAAWSPGHLDERAHAEILDDLPMSAEEIAVAEELRVALEDGARAPEIVTALRAAWSPTALAEAEHRAIVEKAVGGGVARQDDAPSNVVPLRPHTMRRAVVTTTTVLAFAASIIVWITSAPSQSEAPLARARSTQSLFDEPFKAGESSARIDRIAGARASDYRDNRFAKWGVR